MRRLARKYWYAGPALILLLVGYYFSLPTLLFVNSYSTVLEDRNQKLLGATIAPDGQWRFPEGNVIPENYKTALVLFEDKRFYSHPGVDVRALARAIRQNFNAGKISSGGSTLSMQVIRLARKDKPRTYFEKVIEMVLATRLEFRYSKEEILALYAAHAPFGGNVVGLEAACWRYFGRDVEELSWAEAALLAVLPNNPALIHPGKNRAALKQKRDRLLGRLLQAQAIDSLTYKLSIAEAIPGQPVPLPQAAPHLLLRTVKDGRAGTRIFSSVDGPLQEHVQQVVKYHHERLKGNQVFNAAALVLDIKTGNVLAYVGNTPAGVAHNESVDLVMARRSTGSILKPILFAALLDEGKILPATLQPDVPTVINGFAPRNFSKQYDGAVPANQALIRSLNIPAVHQLRDYRYEKFYDLLKHIGITTLPQPADHYGLSLILGGAEGTLWEITGVYASMARILTNYFSSAGTVRYNRKDFHPPHYQQRDSLLYKNTEATSWLSAGALYQTFDALQEVFRPGEETGWRLFHTSKQIAWKTGTSHGLRDAWAIGVNGQYAVGVWVGNADGEGRPGLTGTEAAAPLLFEIFNYLPGNAWFLKPQQELHAVGVCSQSGMRISEWCPQAETQWVTEKGLQSGVCKYHKLLHLSADGRYQVHSGCEPVSQIKTQPWFVLPPVQEYYFKTKNISYKPMPAFKRNCEQPLTVASMEIIYPTNYARIFIPRELDGTPGQVLLQATHRNARATIYWHLDKEFIGTTAGSHKLAVTPQAGSHSLLLLDDDGNTVDLKFTVQ
ncbi:MAG: penicillin-binding protein 1C [Cyclobacteriaceae bacterium]|nr:penicillin-binding protein 1C [Cyclobacteriaceae bacterium]